MRASKIAQFSAPCPRTGIIPSFNFQACCIFFAALVFSKWKKCSKNTIKVHFWVRFRRKTRDFFQQLWPSIRSLDHLHFCLFDFAQVPSLFWHAHAVTKVAPDEFLLFDNNNHNLAQAAGCPRPGDGLGRCATATPAGLPPPPPFLSDACDKWLFLSSVLAAHFTLTNQYASHICLALAEVG